MSIMTQILDKAGLKFGDLKTSEIETLNSMVESLSKNKLTLEDFKDFIKRMIKNVEEELVDAPEFIYIFIFRVENRDHIFLKARLKNLMLINSFLDKPDKAKQAIDRVIAGMVSNR